MTSTITTETTKSDNAESEINDSQITNGNKTECYYRHSQL